MIMITNKEYLRIKHKYNLDMFLLENFNGYFDYERRIRCYLFSDNQVLKLYSYIKNDKYLFELKKRLEEYTKKRLDKGIWEGI